MTYYETAEVKGYCNKCERGTDKDFDRNWSPQLPNTRTVSLYKPSGIHYFEYYSTFKKYYERNFNIAAWVMELAKDGR